MEGAGEEDAGVEEGGPIASVTLKVITLAGEEYSLRILRTATVAALKERLAELTGVCASKQRLLVGDRAINRDADEMVLSELTDGDSDEISMRLIVDKPIRFSSTCHAPAVRISADGLSAIGGDNELIFFDVEPDGGVFHARMYFSSGDTYTHIGVVPAVPEDLQKSVRSAGGWGINMEGKLFMAGVYTGERPVADVRQMENVVDFCLDWGTRELVIAVAGQQTVSITVPCDNALPCVTAGCTRGGKIVLE